MRIAVMGAGAVGGYFGAKLAAASNDVAFIARGPHLAVMRQRGLTLESPQGNLHIRDALFTDDPTGVVYIGSQLLQPGKIKHSSGGKIVFGELDGQVRETTQAVEQVLSSAHISCEVSRAIRNIQWRKLLWNAPFCAISCLTHATVKEIVESDSLTKLALDCMTEVREAAKAQAIDLDSALFEETLNFSKSLGEFKPSMLQDLEAGKPLEYEAFNGIVVELLRRSGKEAPTNQVFYGALKYLDKKIRTERSQ